MTSSTIYAAFLLFLMVIGAKFVVSQEECTETHSLLGCMEDQCMDFCRDKYRISLPFKKQNKRRPHQKGPELEIPSFGGSAVSLHTHIKISYGLASLSTNSVKKDDMVKRVCAEDEIMESESSRRLLLMGKRYISYETLRRDVVPCGTHGASYYNCQKNGVANPYNRGCEIITLCARDAINT
ncbi:RALF-like protein 24 [Tanacetum coccineum]